MELEEALHLLNENSYIAEKHHVERIRFTIRQHGPVYRLYEG